MSLNGTLITGVTGMTAQSAAMGVVSNNIANASTVGFKNNVNRFSTLVASNPGGPSGFGWGGVQGRSQLRADSQGLLLQTQESTSFAIEGRGFFAVANRAGIDDTGALGGTTERLLTRAGDFSVDKNGFLVNSAGMTLLGVQGEGGDVPAFTALTPLQVDPARTLAAEATTEMQLGANLPAVADVGEVHKIVGQAFAGDGTSYGLEYSFTRAAAGTWTATLSKVTSNGLEVTGAAITSAGTTVTFDENGVMTAPTAASVFGTVTLPDGAGTLAPSVTLKLTQFAEGFGGGESTSNGHGELQPVGVSLGSDGILYQTFQNGVVDPIGQVPLVNVINPTGLEAVSGTTFALTDDSGAAAVTAAQQNGAGTLMSERLERSTVDLAEEFSDMIVIQSSYNANSKIISTADSMYAILGQL